jgi:regulator of protease activity HflC (stomatin/prohibitin superfamily)
MTDVNLCVQYEIDDPILAATSVSDVFISLKSLAQSTLVSFAAKTDEMAVEQ